MAPGGPVQGLGHLRRAPLQQQKFEEAYEFFDQKIKEIRTAKFVDDNEYAFDNIVGDLENELKDRENACTLGIELLDRTLLPDAPEGSGSLLPGDQTVLLAATNGGKTRGTITIIKHNVIRRKHVLWFAHEGRANDLAMLLWQAMLNCKRHELFELMRTEEGRQRLDKVRALIRKYVTFVPYMRAGMTVEDVEPIIRAKCEERVAKNQGKGYDLFVSDYPAKLTTRQASGGHMAPRHILDIVYNYHVMLAAEYRYHSVVAYQTNRGGAQVQKGQKEEGRLLTKEDASEAYGPMMTAANVLTLNRPPELYAKGLVTWYIDKSRSGETGWAVCCKSDYGKAITHAPWLGGIRYRGSSNMVEQMDVYMEQYFNGTVPEEIALG
jgi:hypothetical protein